MTTISDSFKRLQEGVSEGLDRVAGTIKPVVTKDVELYTRLKPEDFDLLIQKFGEEPTLGYIQEMEAERLKQHG